MKSWSKIPPGGRRPKLRPGRIVAKLKSRKPDPIETLDEKGIREKLPWLLSFLDVGSVSPEQEYWDWQRQLRDREKRETEKKSSWTPAEWIKLGPGLRSVIPRPRSTQEIKEDARQQIRSRQ